MALSEEHIFKDMQGYKKVTKLKEDHMLPSKLQRYKRAVIFRERAQSALFNQTDDVIDKVYEDICNGISRAEITQKLMNMKFRNVKWDIEQPMSIIIVPWIECTITQILSMQG